MSATIDLPQEPVRNINERIAVVRLVTFRSPYRVANEASATLRSQPGEAVLDTIEAALAEQMSWTVRRGKLVR